MRGTDTERQIQRERERERIGQTDSIYETETDKQTCIQTDVIVWKIFG